ncbi:MAG: nucleotidyltransferase domain-containing protein [Chitinispirillaceae bacterium]|nr:nucleotidyltransferase domain-containing protein [Chitinispirillaceae bacterium]
MSFGLTTEQEDILKEIFKKYLKSGVVIIYGSRAKGTFMPWSDIDIVIKGSERNRQVIGEIKELIEESDFPYLVDLEFYEDILNVSLLEHINRVGKIFYEKKSTSPTELPSCSNDSVVLETL